jgi:pyruvate formate lyase activating enzyme
MRESPISRARPGVLVKTTLVDYPGKVACAVFLRGCNMRCPYCYNAELVSGTVEVENAATAAEIIAHLTKRKDVLTGFVLSGGEPLLSPVAAELASAARGLGYAVKLDTNGTQPEALELFLRAVKPDYVALDVKTAPDRYALFSHGKNFQNELERSIGIIAGLPPDAREFRTVLVPGIVAEDDIQKIARILPKDASWFFAPFKPGGCLDPSYNDITPYTDSQMQNLASFARGLIPGAQIR